jgi:tripartite-type tricarboxylate transporter receptor subunit TctC
LIAHDVTRRLSCFTAGLLSAALIVCTAGVSAQQFPTRPVRMIVPFVAGGGADITARQLAERLGAAWKQPVVIQNSGGAGGNVAVAATASSEPTGYTVLFASVAIIANNPTLYGKLPFDPDRDLAPVIFFGEVPLVLMVSATLAANDVPSFIALARKQPGTLHYGSGGVGTSMHLAGELLKSVAGIDLVHVPFKGANQVVAAIMGNEIQFIFQNAALVDGQVKGGRIKALGIASAKRLAALPDLPTFEESGVANFRVAISYGIYVRAGTPAAVIATLNRDIQAVLDDPAYGKQMAALGFELGGGTPQQLTAYVQAERKKWIPIIRKLGIKGN